MHPSDPTQSERQPAGAPAVAAWLVGPLLLAAIAAAVLLVMRGPDGWFGWAAGGAFAVALAWVLISVFFPARPDRRCSVCGALDVERLDERSTLGLECRACGQRDELASSFLFAEEGTFEDIVLDQRRRHAQDRRAARSSS